MVFIFFSFFPYVSPIPNNFDSQPFSMMFGIIFLILIIIKKGGIAKKFAPLGVFFCIFIILFIFDILISENFSLVARTVANYLSLCFLPVAFYYYLERYGFPKKIFKFSIIVYALIALIQTFWSKYIFEFLVHVRTSDNRGVTSLAPEPTYYGLICYLFLLVLIVSDSFSKKEKIIYGALLIFQILLLAKSSMIFLYLILFFGALFLKSNIKNIIGTSVIFLLSFSYVTHYDFLEGSRIVNLTELASVSGVYAFGQDASMNDRLSHIYLSFYGFFENIALPGLFSTFIHVAERKEEISNGFFWWGGAGNKIMSYWGTIIYEMGVFSILYFSIVLRSISKNRALMLLAFVIPLFAAVPIANPIVSLIIAIGLLNLRKV
jgi:hypothetical protein